MWNDAPPSRVLVLAGETERAELRALFSRAELAGWRPDEADSYERARFCMQMTGAEVVLLDGSLFPEGVGEGLTWLAEQTGVGIVFLADGGPEQVENALRHGAGTWLPRPLALLRPSLLDVVLRRGVYLGRQMQVRGRSEKALRESQERVDHLRALLWEAAPVDGLGPWYTQRHLLYRLEEEVARTDRHGGPLTVILGELQAAGAVDLEQGQRLAGWTAEQVGRSKRRCDVAGRYGLRGFMIVLPRGTSNEALGCCRRLGALLEQAPEESGPLPPVRACFGIVEAEGTATLQGLLGRAEERLERAKESGGMIVG